MQTNRNFSHNSNFIFQTNLFSEDLVIYSIQECNLPGLGFSHIQVNKSAVFGNIQGDTITYNDLSINIIIDEKLLVWKEIIGTLQKMREPENTTSEQIEKMGYLEIHDDNSNPVVKLAFHGMMIESIDDLQFTTNSEDEIITCGITVKYDYYIVS